MSLLYILKFIPSVTTTDEKRVYFYAISHVSIDTNLDPAEDVAIPQQEEQTPTSLTTPPPPPPPSRPRSPQVPCPPLPPPVPRRLVHLAPSPCASPATAEALTSWKTIRFFSAVFRLMVEALAGSNNTDDPVTYAHAELLKDGTRPDMAACALLMPLAMMRGAVDWFLRRRREVMRRCALAEERGVRCMYGRRRGSGVLGMEEIVKEWDAVVIYRRLDRFIDLGDVQDSMRAELEKGGWPDSRFRW